MPIVVTTKRYLNKILASTERTGIESKLIILEPEGRNTCPATTLAVALSLDKNKDDNFIVMPSDHYISMNKRFYDSCKLISKQMEKNHLFLFGVDPDFPSSQFGYILASKGGSVVEIEKFVEKPKFEKAKSPISSPAISAAVSLRVYISCESHMRWPKGLKNQ